MLSRNSFFQFMNQCVSVNLSTVKPVEWTMWQTRGNEHYSSPLPPLAELPASLRTIRLKQTPVLPCSVAASSGSNLLPSPNQDQFLPSRLLVEMIKAEVSELLEAGKVWLERRTGQG